MIADPRVFDDEFVPPDLLHRENEIDQLLRRFTTRHPAESDVLISGPSGVGKTVLARTAVDHLETQTDVTRVFVDSLGKTTGGIPVSRAQLKEIADGVAGVARYGIQSLRSAAVFALEARGVRSHRLRRSDAISALLGTRRRCGAAY